MTLYRDFETNKEVTDVLFCIVSDHNTVKGMVSTLKQPQPTISTKLGFLLKNKIVVKNKWEFDVNWNKIYQVMYKVLKENSPIALQLYVKSYIRRSFGLTDDKIKQLHKVMKNIEVYFPEERLRRILESYAGLFIQTREKASLQEMINRYFVGLIESDKIRLDKKLSELKEIISKMPSEELQFFKLVEE